ncbi:hypothetical protein Csa_015273 [Cucumis sativus]|nr:hypothetical protein Csa_015273 [Cucumis sativus]
MANSQILLSPFSCLPRLPSYPIQSPSKNRFQIHSTFAKFDNFLDLKPESKPQPLKLDLPLFHPYYDRSRFDVVVVGAGPIGLRVAEQLGGFGIKVCCVDPSPLSPWSNNYGVWVDEFEDLGLEDCLHKTWPMASVYLSDEKVKYLDRPYAQVSRKKLKMKLMEECISKGVKFHKAKVWEINHQQFESSVSCNDGTEIKSNLVIDASGFTSKFTKSRPPPIRSKQNGSNGLERHSFEQRTIPKTRQQKIPNIPLRNALRFKPNLSRRDFPRRPAGDAVHSSEKEDGGQVAAFGDKGEENYRRGEMCDSDGGCSAEDAAGSGGGRWGGGDGEPASGYAVVKGMGAAGRIARVAAEGVGGGGGRMIRGRALEGRVWEGVWPMEERNVREFYCFGMEILVRLDLDGIRGFFNAFFDLEPSYWEGLLSSRLSLLELGMLSLSLYQHASFRSKLDILTKSPLPLLQMMANLTLHALG